MEDRVQRDELTTCTKCIPFSIGQSMLFLKIGKDAWRWGERRTQKNV
jgi:hypothetical protein